MKNNKTYLPIYHRSPNKFLHYEMSKFETKSGICANIRTAHYIDKTGKECKMIAQVIWDK